MEKKMKLSKIALLVGLTLNASSVFAVSLLNGNAVDHATNPGDGSGVNVAANRVFYIAGASAQTPDLSRAIDSICSGTLTAYLDNRSSNKAAVAYKCSAADAAKTTFTGPFIAVKTDVDGSFAGVGPLVNNVTQFFPDVTNATINTLLVGGTPNMYSGANVGGTVAFTNGSTSVSKVPDIAFTDVTVDFWRARGQQWLGANLATTGYNSVIGVFSGQGFGVIVSPALYEKLQSDQGLTGCSATTGTAACQPSISKTQYASLVSGTSGVWQKLFTKAATINGMGASDTLTLRRRVSTSGTQAASDAYFLGYGCAKYPMNGQLTATSAGTYTDTTISGKSTTFVVLEESSTSGVTGAISTSTGAYVIGVVSLENLESNTAANKFHYVKIDGQSPNYTAAGFDNKQKLNSIEGKYSFVFEPQIIVRTDKYTTTTEGVDEFGDPSTTTTKTDLGYFVDAVWDQQAIGANLSNSVGLYADKTANKTFSAGNTGKFSRGGNECKALQLLETGNFTN